MLNTLLYLWDVMTWQDFITLVTSLSISLLVGGTIMYFVFSKFLPPRHPNNNNNNQEDYYDDHDQKTKNKGGTLPFEVEEEVARKIRETPAHKALLEQRKAADNFEKKVDTVRRNIPLGASSVLVQKGVRLIEEGSLDEALVCFLALLYSAVEGGKAQPDNLPAHLAECLRGAGTCYRKMGHVEIAARFFQAERLIYEEMVSSVSSPNQKSSSSSSSSSGGNKNGGGDEQEKSRAIVASLFTNVGDDDDEKNVEKGLPRRCRILQDVANACMKHGHVQVALSYQLKMAAVKRKASGKAMEPESDEFHKIAEMLKKLSPEEVQQAASAQTTSNEEAEILKEVISQKKNGNDDE